MKKNIFPEHWDIYTNRSKNLILVGGSSQEGVGRCRNNQFRCNDGQCIPEAYECDGETIWGHDCDDRSDEHRGCRKLLAN